MGRPGRKVEAPGHGKQQHNNRRQANMAKLVKQANGTYTIEGITLSPGKVSSTGKSNVMYTERIKAEGGRVAQVCIYEPIA